MKKYVIEEKMEVAVPVWARRPNRYGLVEGLDDDEIASPEELERIYYKELWGPVLMLPRLKKSRFNPAWDFTVDVDFNAFASVDFQHTQPEFNTVRYKTEKLKEELKNLVITMHIINDRMPGKAKYEILRHVKKGIIGPDDLEGDLWQFAQLYLRALRLRKQILELQEASRLKKEHQLQKWLDSLD